MKKILFIFLVVFLCSCSNQSTSQSIQNVDAALFEVNSNKGNSIIIDVRTKEEFVSGHIYDATNIDYYGSDFKEKLDLVKKDVPILVYCRSGGRSSRAANIMQSLGFTEVYNLSGGIGAWEDSGFDVINSRYEKTNESRIYSAKEINEFLKNNKSAILDFSTQWCVPCKKMKPVLDEISNERDVKILSLDLDANKELSKLYNIKSIPTHIFYKDNIEIFRSSGLVEKSILINQIN
ncbi:thioredoxin domain-containing protein [Bacteroidota bacterium]|nr:thioredoxin domain-containing protein [Bacteroidota bacterium]